MTKDKSNKLYRWRVWIKGSLDNPFLNSCDRHKIESLQDQLRSGHSLSKSDADYAYSVFRQSSQAIFLKKGDEWMIKCSKTPKIGESIAVRTRDGDTRTVTVTEIVEIIPDFFAGNGSICRFDRQPLYKLRAKQRSY